VPGATGLVGARALRMPAAAADGMARCAHLLVPTEDIVRVIVARVAEADGRDGGILELDGQAVAQSIGVVLHERRFAPGVGEGATHRRGRHLAAPSRVIGVRFLHDRVRNGDDLTVLLADAARAARAGHELVQAVAATHVSPTCKHETSEVPISAGFGRAGRAGGSAQCSGRAPTEAEETALLTRGDSESQ
jgi:hypothetical protein